MIHKKKDLEHIKKLVVKFKKRLSIKVRRQDIEEIKEELVKMKVSFSRGEILKGE